MLGIGTTHNMKSVISDVFLPVMLHNEYTLSEKINIWRGKFIATKTANLWCKLVATDLTKKVQKYESEVLLEKAFDNSLPAFLATFLQDKKLSEQEAMEIKKIIEEATK